MPSIHWMPVIAAALSSFVLGGIWYSPAAFYLPWKAAAQLDEAQLRRRSPARTFGGALLLSALSATVFSLFLGPSPSLALGLGAGSSAGLCWVAASFAINYLFECRPLKLLLINGGYHTLQFTLYGLILALWH